MSIITEASEELDKAREHTQKALFALGRVAVEKCQGYDDLGPAFIQGVRDSITKLMEVQDNIGLP